MIPQSRPHAGPAGRVTVHAERLSKRFEEIVAVDGIDFEAHAGECFGFLGPNGAGKTTTMRMIGGSTPVGGGALSVLGLDVVEDARAVKRRLGVVPQESNLDEDLSVEENLRVYGRYFDLDRRTLESRVGGLLDFVQLGARRTASVRALSGGMKRRLLIARALVSEPRVVILDEPTTGLDPQSRHLVWEKLEQLKSQERTLLLTTHYMDEAERLCDRLVVMDAGRIIAEGPPRRLVEEYVAREVVEVSAPRPVRERILARFGAQVSRHAAQEDRLLLFTPDADGLLHALTAEDWQDTNFYSRRATLEDVFLELTGRGLRE